MSQEAAKKEFEVEAKADPSASLRSLELPDPNVVVDDEFAAIWSTAEVIGALSDDDYRWSFTSLLLALLYSEQDISRWFLSYAQSANIHLSEIGSKRGFRPEHLPQMREEFARGGSFLKKSAFTSSVINLFRGAVDLHASAQNQPPSPMGARHLLGAYIYRLPSGHLDELQRWGFVPAHWSASFVQYASAKRPDEVIWADLHQKSFGSPPLSQAQDFPQAQASKSQVTAEEGDAEDVGSSGAHRSSTASDVDKTTAKAPPDVAEPGFVPLRADFSADIIPPDPWAHDQLGFWRDVRAFASVIASVDLTPPMSIGIFGDWGSGKSFFMRQLEQKIKALAGKDKAYCSHIVPVWFNAWHYVDQNLWATLVTEIFDKLYAHIRDDKQEDAAALLRVIEVELSKQQGLHTEAKADLAKAEADRGAAEGELKTLRQRRKEKENSLSTQLNDVATLVIDHPEVKAKLHEVERDLGLPALESSYEAFGAQVEQMQSLGTRTVAILTAAFREPGWIRRIGFLLVVVGLPAIIAVVLDKYMSASDLRTPAQVIAGAVAFLVSATVWLRAVYIAGSAVVSKAEITFAQLTAIRERRAARQEAENIGEIEVLRQREAAARQKLQDAESKIQELRQEAQELQPGRRLQRFIEHRFMTGDYRQHLGLISLIRRDLETLSRLLRERQDLPVDRIVLFIDDLDRCPPDRVCDVLEAIHLILAFELFVVIVGVDVRWVTRALEKRYAGLLTTGHRKEDLASPDDYLEKIFQVPFWINPLEVMGSQELVTKMLEKYPGSAALVHTKSPAADARQGETKTAAADASGDPRVEAISPKAPEVTASPKGSPAANLPAEQVATPKLPEPLPSGTVAPPSLAEDEKSAPIILTEGECKYILELSEFGGSSPRRLKRFINLYRILKATVSESEEKEFLASSGEKGDYKLALVLLALLTGSPSLSSQLLRKLQQPGATLAAVLKDLTADGGAEHRSARGAITHFQSEYPNAPTSAALNRWASVVARYNFQP
jgi:hypothetical protein